jgi:hypothetical protein
MPYLHPSTFDDLEPTQDQKHTMAILRDAARTYAAALEVHLPPGADSTYLLRKLREVSMWANVCVTRAPDGSPRELRPPLKLGGRPPDRSADGPDL